MSETTSSNSSGAGKRRNKKRRKKAASAGSDGASGDHVQDPQPQADKSPDEAVRCQRCKTTLRPASQSGTNDWVCAVCAKADQQSRSLVPAQSQLVPTTSRVNRRLSNNAVGCNCAACVAKRENAVSPEVERDAHITQTYWMEIRHIVRCIYRDSFSLSNEGNRTTISSDKMRSIVKKLCTKDPHQFFQRLETLAREYLLEVKVRLLEQLSCGFNSPQLAIEFIQMLLDEYSTLCEALPALLFLLEPLVDMHNEVDYVQKLGVTIELMNKNIFRELIFAESFMSSNLPLIIAQLRLASLASDLYHRSTAEALSQRYVALEHEMEEICAIWKSAKEQLANPLLPSRPPPPPATSSSSRAVVLQEQDSSTAPAARGHFMEMRQDADAFRQQMRTAAAANHKPPTPVAAPPKLSSEQPLRGAEHSLKWSKELFKCVKPLGEGETEMRGAVVSHTVSLLLDLTLLDLGAASHCQCCRRELHHYRHQLGLSWLEMSEVLLKLNALKALGLSLSIEDLFDEEGYSLVDMNKTLVDWNGDGVEQNGDGSSSELSALEREELEKAKEEVLARQTSSHRTRQTDFLQGLTLRLCFSRQLSPEELERSFIADGGRLELSCFEEVQLRPTQLELNCTRIPAACQCMGDALGLEKGGVPLMCPLGCDGGKNALDYAFNHTDNHKCFMEQLLEKRRQLEERVTSMSPPHSTAHQRPQHIAKEVKPQEEVGVVNFKPVYLPNSSQPCQCSACIGAMAASSSHTTLRPLALPEPVSGGGGGSEGGRGEALSKEGLWQNWMSTSGSAQLQAHANTGHYRCHHGDGGGCIENHKANCSGSCDCHEHGGMATSSAHLNSNGSPSQGTGSCTSGSGDPPRRYCPCCYCELFGHNGPPTAPVSHNFTKQRDKMRQKLEDKKRKRVLALKAGNLGAGGGLDSRPVEELLAFIEGDGEGGEGGRGGGGGGGGGKQPAKKQRKKTKKVSHGDALDHTPSCNGNLAHDPGHLSAGDEVVVARQLASLNLSDSEEDVYDDELEKFKEFCFAQAPVVSGKKLAVSLNMSDIKSKIK